MLFELKRKEKKMPIKEILDSKQKISSRQISAQRRNLTIVCRFAMKTLIDKAVLTAVDDESEEVKNFLAILEKILSHRIKPQKSWYGMEEPGSFWLYIQDACKSLPRSCIMGITALDNIKPNDAKGRAWLRCVLMEKRLSEYLTTAVHNTSLTRKYYLDGAIMLSEDVQILFAELLGLNGIDFSFCLRGDNNDLSAPVVVDYSPYLKFEQSKESFLQDEEELHTLSMKSSIVSSGMTDEDISYAQKFRLLDHKYRNAREQKGYLEEMLRLRENQLDSVLQQKLDMVCTFRQLEEENRMNRKELEGVIIELQEQLSNLKIKYTKLQDSLPYLADYPKHDQEKVVPMEDLGGIGSMSRAMAKQIDADQQSLSSLECSLPHETSAAIKTSHHGYREDTQSLIPLAGSLTSKQNMCFSTEYLTTQQTIKIFTASRISKENGQYTEYISFGPAFTKDIGIIAPMEQEDINAITTSEQTNTDVITSFEHADYDVIICKEVMTPSEHVDMNVMTPSEHVDMNVMTPSEHIDMNVMTPSEHVDIDVLTPSEHADLNVITSSEYAADIDVITPSESGDINVITSSEHADKDVITPSELTDGDVITSSEYAADIDVIISAECAADIDVITSTEYTADIDVITPSEPAADIDVITPLECADINVITPFENDKDIDVITPSRNADIDVFTLSEYACNVFITPSEQADINVITPSEHADINVITPSEHADINVITPSEHADINVITPSEHVYISVITPSEHADINVITPSEHADINVITPSEHADISVITPSEHADINVITPSEHADINVITPFEHASDIDVITPLEHGDINVITPFEHAEDIDVITPSEPGDINVITPFEHASDIDVITPSKPGDINVITPSEYADIDGITPSEDPDIDVITLSEHGDTDIIIPFKVVDINTVTPFENADMNVTTPFENADFDVITSFQPADFDVVMPFANIDIATSFEDGDTYTNISNYFLDISVKESDQKAGTGNIVSSRDSNFSNATFSPAAEESFLVLYESAEAVGSSRQHAELSSKDSGQKNSEDLISECSKDQEQVTLQDVTNTYIVEGAEVQTSQMLLSDIFEELEQFEKSRDLEEKSAGEKRILDETEFVFLDADDASDSKEGIY